VDIILGNQVAQGLLEVVVEEGLKVGDGYSPPVAIPVSPNRPVEFNPVLALEGKSSVPVEL